MAHRAKARRHLLLGAVILIPFFLLCLGPAARAQQESLTPGDVDGNGRVDVNDAILAIQVAVGLVPMSALSPQQIEAADVYPSPAVGPKSGLGWGNGKIDIADALSILRKAAGLAQDPWPGYARPATWSFVQYTLQHSCALTSCHDGPTASAGLSLAQADSYKDLVNAPSADVPTMARIVPFHPEQSYLLTKLTKGPGIVGQRMPWGTLGLPDDVVGAIRRWIAAGAPQNGDPIAVPVDVGAVPLQGGDVHLDPPPAGQGFQLAWDLKVPQDSEVQLNYYQKLPNDVPIDVSKVEMAMSRGSHHFNVFHSPRPQDAVPDHVEATFDAIAFQEYDLMADTQIPDFSWQLPAGVVWRLQPHEQMVIQIHYVNATTQQTPGNEGHVLMNFWYAMPGTVQYHLGAMFAQDTKTLLPPHSDDKFNLVCPFPQNVNILAMTGHYHSRGKQFVVNLWDPKQGDTQKVYESDDWAEPSFTIYNPPIPRTAGQGVDYHTEYVNTTDQTIKFGPYAETQEHNNLFLFYYPALPGDKSLYIFK